MKVINRKRSKKSVHSHLQRARSQEHTGNNPSGIMKKYGHDVFNSLVAPRKPGSNDPNRKVTLPARYSKRRSIPEADTHYRLPTFAQLESAYKSTTLKIPESVIKDRIERVLIRMEKEGKLATTDPIPEIIKKIFPSPGVIVENEFNKVVDVTNRDLIYQTVLDAEAQVKSGDKARLISVMNDSVSLIDQSKSDTANLQLVFGTKMPEARTIYDKAKNALNGVITNIDTAITTDYNRDDPQVGVGGWANYNSQHMHLNPGVVAASNPEEAKATIIHEASHLADSTVIDKGYYNTTGFEAMSEDEKITNAAHFEEVPRRKMGTSSYGPSYEFKPGQAVTGAPPTFEDKVKREVSEYFRTAWSKAVNIHMFLKRVRKAILGGQSTAFTNYKNIILDISINLNLTVHEQDPANATVTQLDIVLSEGVARGIGIISSYARKMIITSPMQLIINKIPGTQDAFAYCKSQFIENSIKNYNALLGDYNKDKALVEYLFNFK